MDIIEIGDENMEPEERIRRAFEECGKGKFVRNPFAGTFGDTAMACSEMADGTCRWEEISMKRPVAQSGTPPTSVA